MKILVTGALGHIGSKLVRELPIAFLGAEILMVDNLMTQRFSSLFDLPKAGKYKFIEADITTVDLQPLMKDVNVVIHLAAITDAAGSFNKAEQLEQNNFNSTRRIAEACASYGVKMIALSSTSVYGSQDNLVDEDCATDDLKPQSPYAITKLKEERFVQQLVKDKGLQAVILRFGTIFGVSQGMRFHTAVNKFCWQAVMKQPITVWRTAFDQKRPYLGLEDAIKAMVFVIKNNLFAGTVYNVVSSNSTVRNVVEAIKVDIPDLNVEYVDSPIMNQLSYEVINTRFTKMGFKVESKLEIGIKDTLELLINSNARAIK